MSQLILIFHINHLRKGIIFLFFCITTLVVQAQNITKYKGLGILDISNMISLFHDSSGYVSYDHINVPGWFSPSIVVPSPLTGILQEKVYAEWEISRIDSMLYLKHIMPAKDISIQTDTLFRMLSKQHANMKNGIFAQWFTGRLFVLTCPRQLFNMFVSKDAIFYEITNGKVQKIQQVYLPYGEMEASSWLMPDGRILVRQDGCWYSDISKNLHMMFDPILNKNIPVEFVNLTRKKYSFFLNTNPKSKKISLYILSPLKLSGEDNIIVAYLKKKIEELPSNSFGPLVTINKKILYGRYLQIILDNGKFETQDYLLK